MSGVERTMSVLDIGTAKTCCMILAVSGDNSDAARPGGLLVARLLGFGQHRSAGVKAGVIVDLGKAELAVRKAITRAEEMAGLQIDDVVISVSCGRIKSTNFQARIDTGGVRISDRELNRLFRAGKSFARGEGRRLLHLNGLGYALDGDEGIADPRGLTGRELRADLHAVTADELPLRNLTTLVERCYLNASDLIAAPFASGLPVVSDEEARLGAAVIDIGAGTTTIAVFAEGHFIHADAVALGGAHITYDIARQLSTPLEEAERIKTLYANMAAAASDTHELISYPVMEQDEVGLYQLSRAELRGIVRPRIEEILGIVRQRLDDSGMADYASDRLVLTGGGAQLAGLQEFAEQVTEMHTRIGEPDGFAGVPESLVTPAYAGLLGLVRATASRTATTGLAHSEAVGDGGGVLGQVGRWFRESFWEDERAQQSGTY